jgi:hypothetical protein
LPARSSFRLPEAPEEGAELDSHRATHILVERSRSPDKTQAPPTLVAAGGRRRELPSTQVRQHAPTLVEPGSQVSAPDIEASQSDAILPSTKRGFPVKSQTVEKRRIAEPRPPRNGQSERQLSRTILVPETLPHPRRDELVHTPEGGIAVVGPSTPTIHVHIGKIEVRAVPEPKGPARQRRQTPPAMNLEEYLERIAPGRKK